MKQREVEVSKNVVVALRNFENTANLRVRLDHTNTLVIEGFAGARLHVLFQAIEQSQQSVPDGFIICANCRWQNYDVSRTCVHCGTPLRNELNA